MSNNLIYNIVHLANAINILEKSCLWTGLPVSDFLNIKRGRKKVEVAEVNNDDNKRETLVTQTTIRLIKEERRKAMSKRMMKEEKEN